MTASGVDDCVLELVRRFAPTLLPGATVESGSQDLLVPAPGGRARVSLRSLRAETLDAPVETREEIVRRWLSGVAAQVGLIAAQPDPNEQPPPVELLRLRVMPAWAPAEVSAFTSTPVPLTFDALVVYPDRSGRVAYLPAALGERLGGSVAAAAVAIRQTIRSELSDLAVTQHQVDGHLLGLLGKPGNPFITTALISMERFVPPQAAGGAFVLAPAYDSLIFLPVLERSALDAVPMLSAMARERFADAADPCSPAVHWWHDGTFYEVDASPDGQVHMPTAAAPVFAALG